MNRAPFALLVLLCTLASSMVAAGVASDRPAAPRKKAEVKITPVAPILVAKTNAKPPRQTDWLLEVGVTKVDVHRYLIWAADQLPIVSLEIPGARLPANITEEPKAEPKPEKPAKPVAATAAKAKPASKPVAMTPAAAQPRIACSVARPVFELSTTTKLRPQPPTVIDSRQLHGVVSQAARSLANQPKAAIKPKNATKPDNRPTRVTLGPSKLRWKFSTLSGDNWTSATWYVPPYATQGGAAVLSSAAIAPATVAATYHLPGTFKPVTITVIPTWYESAVAQLSAASHRAIRQYQEWSRQANAVQQAALEHVAKLYGKVSVPSWLRSDGHGEVRSAKRPEKAESR